MKKILLPSSLPTLYFSMLLAIGLLSACSNDDETKEKGTDVTFSLLHENGSTSDSFDTNEAIVFSLSLKTRGNPEFTKGFDSGDLIVDDNLFTIYNEDGTIVGQPNREQMDFYIYETTFGPYVLQYNWSKDNGDNELKPGRYYTRFSIRYNTAIWAKGNKFESKEFFVNFKVK